MVRGIIIEENCINCKKIYSQELKYCPNCGSKNSHYMESDRLINEFKKEVENNNYFNSKLNNELKKLNENSYFKSSKDTDSKNHNSSFKSSEKSSKNDASNFSTFKGNSDIKKTDYTTSFKIRKDITCPNCGAKNDKSYNFCVKCGTSLKKN